MLTDLRTIGLAHDIYRAGIFPEVSLCLRFEMSIGFIVNYTVVAVLSKHFCAKYVIAVTVYRIDLR